VEADDAAAGTDAGAGEDAAFEEGAPADADTADEFPLAEAGGAAEPFDVEPLHAVASTVTAQSTKTRTTTTGRQLRPRIDELTTTPPAPGALWSARCPSRVLTASN